MLNNNLQEPVVDKKYGDDIRSPDVEDDYPLITYYSWIMFLGLLFFTVMAFLYWNRQKVRAEYEINIYWPDYFSNSGL